jgi:pSer/pThr/pTyr-binding forkhead associated (FHA) protein
MARLVVSPEGEAKVVELGQDSVSIGREAGNAVALSGESKASRRHCQVVPISSGFEIVDLDSRNGTRVNGDAVKRRRLAHGDVIEVGTTKIRYEDEAAAARDAKTKDACFLEHASGDRKGERIPLTAPRTTLGRRESNTVPLSDKMASGHHAEIVKDLNGYTIRDLGSTNGTLVNGEPTTETVLTHGARVRIGNSRFVFKDPSMADVDVELAGLREEDDAGWGMMAEIDVGRVRGGGGGLAAALLLVAGLAGAAWYFAGRETQATDTPVGDFTNQLTDPHFDSSEGVAWGAPEGTPVSVSRTEKARPGGGGALVVRHKGDEGSALAAAVSADDLEIARSSTYRVQAQMRREGSGRADLAVQWIGRASKSATAVVRTVTVGSAGGGSWQAIDAVVWPPPWADSARLAVVVAPGTGAQVDDVRFAAEGSFDPTSKHLRLPGDKEATVGARGGVDLLATGTVLFVGATPWARMPGGKTVGGPSAFVPSAAPGASSEGIAVSGEIVDGDARLPATLELSPAPEGATLRVSVPGAEAVGWSADFPRAHLDEGVSALGAFSPARLEPAPGGLDSARKVLAGEPRPSEARPATIVAVETADGRDDAALRITQADDAGLLRVGLARPGAEATFKVVTDLMGERQRAQKELDDAKSRLEGSPGEAIRLLRAVADSYPFHEKIRQEALDAANQREERARKDVEALGEALEAFAVYGSREAIADAKAKATRLAEQFPAGAASSGALEASVRDLVARVEEARARFDAETATPEVRRLARLAQMLEAEPGYEAVAAIYYREIVRRFGSVSEGEVGKRVGEARERLEALLAKDAVRDAVPTLPGGS